MWNFRKSASVNSHGSRYSTRSRRSAHARTDFFISQNETLYPPWWTREVFVSWYRDLPEDTLWNCYICASVLIAIVWVAGNFESIYLEIVDVVYNITYAAHVIAIGYKMIMEREYTDVTRWVIVGYLIDLSTYFHYINRKPKYKLACYYLRLHRPFKYLWSLYDYNLKGSILGTTLKYCYIFLVLRITWAWIWLHVNLLEQQFNFISPRIQRRMIVHLTDIASNDSDATKFLSSLYIVNKMFIPIGIPVVPDNDIERVTCLFVIISGCLVVSGAAVATLSLVISLYMSPEETFRSRYRLIIKEMEDSHVPPRIREKVQKFYGMYWHKQRAVSETKLLPTFPPTLPATVYTDIYFEATQKSRILRELPYQFLSELAKKMETIHYIPGDAIIERRAKKSAIIYITYGDIEMLTAEDDITAILRFTRGTVLAPCGGAAAAAVSRSHLTVRAATFCTAHVLHASDLWRVVNKHAVCQDNAGPILAAFSDHIQKVKRHYSMKIPVATLHKSSILHFNRNLMALKEMKDANGEPLLASTEVFLEIAGCYIMRNRLDSTLTDESDAICLRPTFPCILQPSSSLLLAWHTAVACLILIICITHPYFLVFLKEVPVEFRFFDYFATGVYVVDHIVHLSTGAHVEEGVPITFAQTSSQQMRSKWFVLDLVGTLPIFEYIGDGHFAGINKILRLPKVFRLLKIMEDNCVYHSNVIRFCSYTLLLLIACYLIAALQQAFMCYQSGYCLVTNFTHSPFWEKKDLDEETVEARLTFGLYWAISMIMFTTHMETWGKENMSNVMYTMIILEFCIVLRTFMEAVYSATIMVTTAMREDYDARIATVKQFLIRNEVDPQLRRRFITYLQLSWYTDKAYKMTHNTKTSSIFYDLPQHVYQDIVGRNRVKYILCIPFMKMLNKEELKQLASNAHLYYTSPNEILMNTGDLVNEMYVVVKGICEIFDPNTRTTIGEITAKCHFGAVVCLLRIPAYFTIRAVTHVQMFCISLRHMKPVFENPQIKEAIEYVKAQPVYARMQRRQPSFLKYVPLPPIPNTERFPLPRKHEPDFAYLHPFKSLGFLSILRYIFPRFTIRPDGKYLLRCEWVRVSCALLSAMVFPNYTYLVLQWPSLYYLTWLLDLSAVFDIFQRMLVGYYNSDGILVYHPSSTAAYYMKGPFIVDLMGCLALEKLESERIETYENGYRVSTMEQFLMMNRLLQLYRFPSIMQTLHYYIERRDIHMVIYAIPLFISMFNILTCLMIFNSVKIFYFINEDGQTRWLLEPFQDKGGSWIDLFRTTFRFNLTSSPWNLYLATHFWVVYETTTTGYAKFKPSNNHLMDILFIGMAMSAMIITYFSVRIISIRSKVNKPLAGFQQHMRDIIMFMKRENLNPKLQSELRRYYEYNWEKMGGINYRGMLKLCNQITLRTDAILHIYGPTFAKCPLLANCDLSLLRMIGRSVRSVYFLRDMKIVEYDDVVKDVYFVDYGRVESRVPVGEMHQVVRLPRGSLFGNLDGTPAQRVPMDIVATSRLHLLMINSQAFYHIINEFPITKALMEKSRNADNKHYILGNMEDFKVKLTRDSTSTPVRTTRMDIIKYIYFQEGCWVLLYLIVVSLTCIYMDLYNAGYQDNRAWLILTLYILDMCFFLKILLQLSLPLLVTNKNLKTLLLPIRRLYFKREFKYDMISCVPIELLSFEIEKNRWLWFSWLRLNRMFRIVTVYNCLKQRNERINVNLIMSTILTVAIWFSVFVHATTCLWYFIGRLEEQAQPKSSWIYNDDGSSWCGNEYICSLYFVITTFTQNGVGDIMPKKQSEVVFVTILMIISTMVFMIYVGEFSNIIQYQSFRSFSFYSEYLELQAFLKNNRVSRNLVTIVNKYTLHLWRESRGLQVPHFLMSAPLSLRLRVMSAAYMHHINRHHIFEDCEPAFLRQLVGCLRLYTYNEDMFVVKENEITDCMYVIHRGKVKETSENMPEDLLARVYPAGTYFGVLQGLVRDSPYTYSYQTTIKSQVLTLHLDDWEYLLAHFPQSKATIHKHMRNVAGRDMEPAKWPGGLDPKPPPGAGHVLLQVQTEIDASTSNLPKFYPYGNKRISEAGPSSRSLRQDPMASTSSLMSRDDSKYDFTESGQFSSRMTGISATQSLTSLRKTSQDKMKMEIKTVKEEQEFPKVGIMEKIASAAKKLMGRYSDTNFDMSESDIREEEATGALLKQLDEARRLSRKRKYRSTKRRTRFIKEEETEKSVMTFEMSSLNTDESEHTDSQTNSSLRPFRIWDSGSITTLHGDGELLIMDLVDKHIAETTHDIVTPDTRVASVATSGREATPSMKSLDQKSSTLQQDGAVQKIKTTLDEEVIPGISENILETEATLHTPEIPGWGMRVRQDTDADIGVLPDSLSTEDRQENLNNLVSTGVQTTGKEEVSVAVQDEIQGPEDNHTNVDVESSLENQPDADTQPVPETALAGNLPDEALEIYSNIQIAAESLSNVNDLPVPDTKIKPESEYDDRPVSEILEATVSQLDADTQAIPDTVEDSSSNRDIETVGHLDHSVMYSEETLDSTPDTHDNTAVRDFRMVPGDQPKVIIQGISDTSPSQNGQSDEISQAILDTQLRQGEQPGAHKRALLDTHTAQDIQPDANIRDIPVSSTSTEFYVPTGVDKTPTVVEGTDTSRKDIEAENKPEVKDASTSPLRRTRKFIPISFEDSKPSASPTEDQERDEEHVRKRSHSDSDSFESGSDISSRADKKQK